MSSSPTIIWSSVDFPDPDGPTRITNSPSAISRLTSSTAASSPPNRFVTFLIEISLIGIPPRSSLYSPAGEAGDDPALEQQDDDDDGDRYDDGCGRDRRRRLIELRFPAEERERGGHRPSGLGRRQRDAEDEVVPRREERDDGRREHAWGRERHHDLPHRLPGRGSVDLRSLLERARDL